MTLQFIILRGALLSIRGCHILCYNWLDSHLMLIIISCSDIDPQSGCIILKYSFYVAFRSFRLPFIFVIWLYHPGVCQMPDLNLYPFTEEYPASKSFTEERAEAFGSFKHVSKWVEGTSFASLDRLLFKPCSIKSRNVHSLHFFEARSKQDLSDTRLETLVTCMFGYQLYMASLTTPLT